MIPLTLDELDALPVDGDFSALVGSTVYTVIVTPSPSARVGLYPIGKLVEGVFTPLGKHEPENAGLKRGKNRGWRIR